MQGTYIKDGKHRMYLVKNRYVFENSIAKVANAFDQKFHICQAITAQLQNSEPIRLEM